MTYNFLPVCKICGERHRLGRCEGPHGTQDEDPKAQGTQAQAAPGAAAQDQGRPLHEPAAADGAPGKVKFDRTGYQRDYMRKRRAAKKVV